MGRKISIILPCYNEWKNIFKNIEFLNMYLNKYLKKCDYELILVNDWSKDNTKDEIIKLEKKFNFVKVVDYRINMWKWFAINRWLKEADWELIAFYDSDLDIEPDSLVKHINFLIKNKKYSMVIWSKEHRKSRIKYSIKRNIMSKFNIFLNKILFWLPVKDTQTWLKVFRKELKNIFSDNVKIFWYAFDVEFIYNVNKRNHKIKEKPVKVNLSTESSVNFLSIVHYLKELMIFYKKVSYRVSYKKIRFTTKFKLLLITFAVFPIENSINLISFILRKKNWFLLKKNYNKD